MVVVDIHVGLLIPHTRTVEDDHLPLRVKGAESAELVIGLGDASGAKHVRRSLPSSYERVGCKESLLAAAGALGPAAIYYGETSLVNPLQSSPCASSHGFQRPSYIGL